MAKKVTLESLKIKLGELESKEQTADVMAEIDELKATIEKMEAEEKALAEEIAAKEAEKERLKAEKEAKKAAKSTGYTHYEKWELRNGKNGLERSRFLKEVILLPEQARILNSQKMNSLVEYIEKEA